jgi:hypothetical protein
MHMTTHGLGGEARAGAPRVTARGRSRAMETRPALQTTEMIAYVAVTIAVLVAAAIADDMGARQAWLYVTILTVGYMVSRGLAKSGSYERDAPYDDGPR